MEIQDLNELANDLAVARAEIANYEKTLSEIPEVVELQAKIEEAKTRKDELQNKLLGSMRDNELKSWKTDYAVFARASRKSVTLNPAIKKNIEDRVKNGEVIEGWELRETEYMSIRTVK